MFADGLLPVWLLLVLIGVGLVVIFKVGLAVVSKQAQRQRERTRAQDVAREQQRLDTAAARQRSAEQACGMWCWWNTKTQTKTGGAIYKLERHNVPREEKERERQQHLQQHLAIQGLWLAQTDEHSGETTAHYLLRGCAACERLMDAHLEEVASFGFAAIGYESQDGYVHMQTN